MARKQICIAVTIPMTHVEDTDIYIRATVNGSGEGDLPAEVREAIRWYLQPRFPQCREAEAEVLFTASGIAGQTGVAPSVPSTSETNGATASFEPAESEDEAVENYREIYYREIGNVD